MNKKILALSLLCMSAFPLAALAAEYHAPSTDAEHALDDILMQQKSDSRMDDYLTRKTPDKSDADYARFFTPAYKKAVLKVQSARMKNGGISFSPVTCGQDTTDTVYLYRTVKSGKNEATVAYIWPKETTPAATYHMRKENGSWKIDGARCADEITRFNMK